MGSDTEAGATSPSTPSSSWSRGVAPGVLFGGLAAVVSVVAIGRAWAACDVGGGGNGITLLLLAPVIWVAAAVPWLVLHGTLGRRHRGAALAVGLVFTVWFTWFLVTWLGIPDSYPAPLCPGNVPPWWPSLLPT
ncbi:hypothetical protein ACFZC6_30295 [Streptomyces ossamyceticus]|uniref:Phospholipase D-like protein n=1 Tax=Streptomyces ossamyceticus TaxID=249581 RepID=A0ABV2V689_9ACTN